MDQCQNPHRVVLDFIDEAVARVRDQLAGAGDLARLAEPRVVGEPAGGRAEQLVDANGCRRIFSQDMAKDLGAIGLGRRRPADFQARSTVLLSAAARSAANSASTSS